MSQRFGNPHTGSAYAQLYGTANHQIQSQVPMQNNVAGMNSNDLMQHMEMLKREAEMLQAEMNRRTSNYNNSVQASGHYSSRGSGLLPSNVGVGNVGQRDNSYTRSYRTADDSYDEPREVKQTVNNKTRSNIPGAKPMYLVEKVEFTVDPSDCYLLHNKHVKIRRNIKEVATLEVEMLNLILDTTAIKDLDLFKHRDFEPNVKFVMSEYCVLDRYIVPKDDTVLKDIFVEGIDKAYRGLKNISERNKSLEDLIALDKYNQLFTDAINEWGEVNMYREDGTMCKIKNFVQQWAKLHKMLTDESVDLRDQLINYLDSVVQRCDLAYTSILADPEKSNNTCVPGCVVSSLESSYELGIDSITGAVKLSMDDRNIRLMTLAEKAYNNFKSKFFDLLTSDGKHYRIQIADNGAVYIIYKE